MPSRINHRAVPFKRHQDVPNGSTGYFSPSDKDALKDTDGRWFIDGKEVKPQKDWHFTSHTGPANDEAFRALMRDELLLESIGITPQQANTVLGALYAKLTESESYARGYERLDKGPRPEDECCDYHLMRFNERVAIRDAMRQRVVEEKALIEVFTGLASLPSPKDQR